MTEVKVGDVFRRLHSQLLVVTEVIDDQVFGVMYYDSGKVKDMVWTTNIDYFGRHSEEYIYTKTKMKGKDGKICLNW